MKRADTRCKILSCKFGHSHSKNGGCVCDYSYFGSECLYSPRALEWFERGGLACFTHLDQDDGNGRGPHSLTARCDQARRASSPMTPEQARQRALALEMELSEVER